MKQKTCLGYRSKPHPHFSDAAWIKSDNIAIVARKRRLWLDTSRKLGILKLSWRAYELRDFSRLGKTNEFPTVYFRIPDMVDIRLLNGQ